MTTRVLLADDQALLRATFRLLLDATPDMEVVGEAVDGREAVELARRHRPDVVLMDVRMPGVDGVEATRAITDDPALTDVRIVVLTTFEVEEVVVEALRAGASGFLGKGVEPAALLDGIRTVAAGEALLSPTAVRAVVGRVVAGAPAAAALDTTPLNALTPREREILALVGLGLSNDRIAERLVISPVTAKTHVNRTMAKLHARDRAQLVVIAYETGLVVPGREA